MHYSNAENLMYPCVAAFLCSDAVCSVCVAFASISLSLKLLEKTSVNFTVSGISLLCYGASLNEKLLKSCLV